MAVPNVHWNTECPKSVFKVDPHWLLSQALTSLWGLSKVQHRIFKIPPTFLSSGLWAGSLSKAAEWVCMGSSQSPASLHFVFCAEQAVDASKEWKWNASVLIALRRGQSSVAQTLVKSPSMLLHGNWMCLWTDRVRRYEYWQLTERKALFNYLSQDLSPKPEQNPG